LDFLVMTSERIWLPDLYVQNSVGDTEAPLENYASQTAQVGGCKEGRLQT
jgi:hypothetical protein